jgi:hypothetical protein
MAIDNVSNKAALNAATISPELSALSLASSLPREALHAKEFQPLYLSINPAEVPPFSPVPQPFSKTSAFDQFFNDPGLLVSTLQGASGGLSAFVDSLNVAGSDQQVADHLAKAKAAFDAGKPGEAQQELMEAQKIQAFISTMLSIVNQMEMDAIKNSKLQ